LSLDVDLGESGFESVISGRVSSYGDAVVGKKVKIYVNDTLRAEPTAQEGYGDFSVTLNLPSVDNKPTVYNIQAVFEGEEPQNVSAYAYTPNGTRYAICTTVQYELEPSSNMTTLTVDPHSTQVTQATKTPEQLEQEAKSSGWFWVEPEFSWRYPWFRLHYRLSINLPQGNPNLDYGWSPLPLGESSSANETALANIMNDATEGSDPYALAEFFAVLAVPFIIQATAAHLLGRTIAGIALATAIYGAFLVGYTALNYLRAEGNPKSWLMIFIGATFVELATLFVVGGEGVVNLLRFLTTAGRLVLDKIQHPLQALHALKLNFFAITSAIFALMDFAIMIFYLLMYLQTI
jgi:hypothetical protein